MAATPAQRPAPSSFQRVRLRRFLRRIGMMVAVVGALHCYVADRVLAISFLPGPAVFIGWIFFALAFLSLPLGMFGMLFPRGRLGWARTVGHHWLGAFFILLSLTAVTDLTRGIVSAFSSIPAVRWSDWQGEIIALIGPLLIALALVNGRRDPKVVHRRVRLDGLGEGLRGFSIVQLSDLHVGHPGTDRDFLQRLVRRIEKLRPDAIAITGDAVEGSPEALREAVAPLGELRAAHGVYYVTGNHEY